MSEEGEKKYGKIETMALLRLGDWRTLAPLTIRGKIRRKH